MREIETVMRQNSKESRDGASQILFSGSLSLYKRYEAFKILSCIGTSYYPTTSSRQEVVTMQPSSGRWGGSEGGGEEKKKEGVNNCRLGALN